MDNQNKKSISDTVLDEIKSGGVKMHNKIYFVLKAVFYAFIIIVAVLFILYLVSFIIFSLRASGTWFLPRFGSTGIKILLASLPWILILIAVLAVALLETFTKRFKFVYRQPIIYSFLGIIVIAVALGFLLEKTALHSNLFLRSREDGLPGVGDFYRNYGAPPMRGANFGIVLKVIENGFLIQMPHNETTTIITTDETSVHEEEIKVGDRIVILGEITNGVFQAFDIRKIEEDFDFFHSTSSRENFFPEDHR